MFFLKTETAARPRFALRATQGKKQQAPNFRGRSKTHTPVPRMQGLGYRSYSPGIGRWTSKDPIGERGGWHLYAFLRNCPLNACDPIGLSAEKFHCCDEQTINSGEETLKAAYEEKKKEMEKVGRPHRGKGDNSCYAVNSDVVNRLYERLPACWGCTLHHRTMRPLGYVWRDHHVVVCRAKDKNGQVVRQITFDYWANRPAGESTEYFYKKYPHAENSDNGATQACPPPQVPVPGAQSE